MDYKRQYVGGIHPSDLIEYNSSKNINRCLVEMGLNSSYSRHDTVGGDSCQSEMATFNRYGVLFADDEASSTLGYVFMVRPDLNIIKSASQGDITLTEQMRTDVGMAIYAATDPTLLLNLTQNSTGGYSHQFMPLLYDRVDEFQITPIELHTHEMTQPFSNFKTVYAGNANNSLSQCQFSIGFRETSDLRVTKLFHVWISYINGITLNLFAPKDEYLKSRWTHGAQVIDYATSIYFIRTKPDGEIIFFHKITGAFPTNVPCDQQSYNRGGQTDNKIQVNFAGGFPESLNPLTLREFNENSLGKNFALGELAKDYDPYYSGASDSGDIFTSSPAIFVYNGSGRKRFFLSWQKYQPYEEVKQATYGSIPNIYTRLNRGY